MYTHYGDVNDDRCQIHKQVSYSEAFACFLEVASFTSKHQVELNIGACSPGPSYQGNAVVVGAPLSEEYFDSNVVIAHNFSDGYCQIFYPTLEKKVLGNYFLLLGIV